MNITGQTFCPGGNSSKIKSIKPAPLNTEIQQLALLLAFSLQFYSERVRSEISETYLFLLFFNFFIFLIEHP